MIRENIAASRLRSNGVGNESLFADYERRFLASLALLYPPETHAKW